MHFSRLGFFAFVCTDRLVMLARVDIYICVCVYVCMCVALCALCCAVLCCAVLCMCGDAAYCRT
jgi:hypothetical protein